MAYFQFLGTGPSTPITDAAGRNYRRRSSALMQHIATYVLIDATHDLEQQMERALSVTAVVVTNSSRDAAGGLGSLDRWVEQAITFYAPDALWEEVVARYGPFERLEHATLKPLEPVEVGDLELTAFPVNRSEAEESRLTFGYHFDTGKKKVTYASDFKHIPEESERFFRGNDILVVDAAGWDKDLPTHRGALNHLAEYVAGENERILFTDVGRSAPPHTLASSSVRRVFHGADVAYDFMKIPLGR
ncbi:MAG: MBL fold metallo-hydrolase [Myxococcota bacterium]